MSSKCDPANVPLPNLFNQVSLGADFSSSHVLFSVYPYLRFFCHSVTPGSRIHQIQSRVWWTLVDVVMCHPDFPSGMREYTPCHWKYYQQTPTSQSPKSDWPKGIGLDEDSQLAQGQQRAVTGRWGDKGRCATIYTLKGQPSFRTLWNWLRPPWDCITAELLPVPIPPPSLPLQLLILRALLNIISVHLSLS